MTPLNLVYVSAVGNWQITSSGPYKIKVSMFMALGLSHILVNIVVYWKLCQLAINIVMVLARRVACREVGLYGSWRKQSDFKDWFYKSLSQVFLLFKSSWDVDRMQVWFWTIIFVIVSCLLGIDRLINESSPSWQPVAWCSVRYQKGCVLFNDFYEFFNPLRRPFLRFTEKEMYVSRRMPLQKKTVLAQQTRDAERMLI